MTFTQIIVVMVWPLVTAAAAWSLARADNNALRRRAESIYNAQRTINIYLADKIANVTDIIMAVTDTRPAAKVSPFKKPDSTPPPPSKW